MTIVTSIIYNLRKPNVDIEHNGLCRLINDSDSLVAIYKIFPKWSLPFSIDVFFWFINVIVIYRVYRLSV